MSIRYALCLIILAWPFGAADAQVTLDQADFPLQLGSHPFANLSTENEGGANTAAIEALIALSGPGQTYDFTTVAFEDQIEGMIEVEAGAMGPAAAVEPLDRATLTAVFPFVIDDEEITAEGTIYFYHLVTDEVAVELGSFFDGEADGDPFQVTTTNTPDGQVDATFPYTFGSMWSSAFTQTISFGGFETDSEISETSEVDGWGTLFVPGVEVGLPALRVKVTTEVTVKGITSTDVCYEMRSDAPVVASVCEGSIAFGDPPTADLARVGMVVTAGEEAGEAVVAALAPAYPNPARNTIALGYRVPEAAFVELVVYDVLGRPVLFVVEARQGAGAHTEVIDVAGLPAGLYMLRLTVNGRHWTRRLTVTR